MSRPAAAERIPTADDDRAKMLEQAENAIRQIAAELRTHASNSSRLEELSRSVLQASTTLTQLLPAFSELAKSLQDKENKLQMMTEKVAATANRVEAKQSLLFDTVDQRMRGFTTSVIWILMLAALAVAGAGASIFLLLTRNG